MSEIKTISVNQLQEITQQGQVDLIDVRTPAEFREVHATMARNVPLGSIDVQAEMNGRSGVAGDPLYLICHTGGRSSKACQKFLQAGFENVVNVSGGTLAWDATGLPVVRGKKTISLERQVRIAAGFLVLSGVVLGTTVHEYFLGICGFVGVGLMFAGITDFCGMGLLLGKMPWNQACKNS